MAAAWWHRAPDLFEAATRRTGSRPPSSYQLGLGRLELDSDDEPLNLRFSEIYPEGQIHAASQPGPRRVLCSVRSLEEPSVAAVAFEDPEDLDSMDFCRALFPDRGYVDGPEAPDGWRTLATRAKPEQPVIAMQGPRALVDRDQAWQPLVANLAVNRVLRLQRDLVFFHAASVRVAGRGLILMGPKASGKTTTSLTLASRGHPFLGDEVAAVRPADLALLPFRRAASIRAGMRADRVTRRLDDGAYPSEVFPDGSARVLANVADLFPEARVEEASPLRAAFFLSGFEPRPRAEPFEFGREHFALLTPIASSLWKVPIGFRMLQLSRLMLGLRCYHLHPGRPEETADLIETLAKEWSA
jgi:hypothetical protein